LCASGIEDVAGSALLKADDAWAWVVIIPIKLDQGELDQFSRRSSIRQHFRREARHIRIDDRVKYSR